MKEKITRKSDTQKSRVGSEQRNGGDAKVAYRGIICDPVVDDRDAYMVLDI